MYKFIVSQPSGFDTISSAVEPFSLDGLVLVLAPFLARFLADPEAADARRLTPEAGELDLPLVAGDINVFEECLAIEILN